MSQENNTVKQESVLSRRLKTIIEARKQIHNPATWLPVKDKAYTFLVTSNDEKLPFITITIQIACLQLKFLLPKIIEPAKVSVYSEDKGFNRKSWSYKYAPKIYGVGYLPKETVFHFFYGVNSGNSRGFPKDKLFVWIPAWARYRLVEHLVKDKNNLTFWRETSLDTPSVETQKNIDLMGSLCAKLRFECVNEGSCRVFGNAYVEERKWNKGFFFGKTTKMRRVLKIHLQVTNGVAGCRPHSLQYDFIMLPKEDMNEAIHRFCKSRVMDKDKSLRLYLEYIEPQ